jgi:hypothetical protein
LVTVPETAGPFSTAPRVEPKPWQSLAGLAAEKVGLLIPQGGYLVIKVSEKYQKGIGSDKVQEKLLAEAKGVHVHEYLVSGSVKDIFWRMVQRFKMQWWMFALMEKGETYIY